MLPKEAFAALTASRSEQSPAAQVGLLRSSLLVTVKVIGGTSVATVVVVVAELLAIFKSAVWLDALTVFDKTVSGVVAALTFTTKENDADAPLAKLAVEQFTVPVPPTAGVVQTKAGPVF